MGKGRREISENSVLTNRGDPGVTQSNPRKVALDAPLLNGLKGEEPRNILVKETQGLHPFLGRREPSLYTLPFPSTENCPPFP